ncbi:MAG: hypothetical protein ACRDHM_09840 [Actinomycetota bacterium]
MDEATLMEAARYHMLAVLSGDRQGAMQDVVENARTQAEPVFAALPPKVEEAEVMQVTQDADQFVVEYNYIGGDTDVVVESVWQEQEGKPVIIGIRLS